MRALKVLIPALVLLAACSDPSARSRAQDAGLAQPTRSVPASGASMRLSFAPVVKKAAPAVVNVSSKRVVRQQIDPFWQMFGAVPGSRVEGSLGSGSIVRSDGVIVTNHHNIEGAQEIMVQLADRREFPAKVLLDDPRSDLAVLKIDTKGEKLPVIAIDDADQPEVGDLVLAIGNPFGVGQTVTNGIVSATARSGVGINDFGFFLQTDAAINPGNSGGPLVDMDGDLIGVNTAILSRSGTSSGVGFAIPAAMVKQVVGAALGGSRSVARPWLGAKTQGVTADIAASMGQRTPRGALISDVWPGSSADKAGLKPGDIILKVGGQDVIDESGVTYYFAGRQIGDQEPLVILRGGQEKTINVRAEAAPGSPTGDERAISGRNPLDGASIATFTPALADAAGLDPFAGKGVVVTKVGQGFAMEAGFRPGDFVVAINGQRVSTVSDVASILNGGSRGWRVTILRGGQEISADFRL